MDNTQATTAKSDILFELEQRAVPEISPATNPVTAVRPFYAGKNYSSDNVPAKIEDMQKYSDLDKMIEEAYMTYNMRESFVQSHIDPKMQAHADAIEIST